MHRAALSMVICFVLLPLCAGNASPVFADAARPNVLFIFSDDQCFQTIRALGNEQIETPNLDRLVRSGLTFSHAYNMGSWSGAVCIPSRQMLNTGRFLWNAHRVMDVSERERQEGRFWSEYMKQAGYDTYFTGKWHLRADVQKAFDHVRHVRPGMPNQTEDGYNRPLPDQPDPWSPYDPQFGGFWQGGRHWSEIVADDVEKFLQTASGRDQPFFMYVAFNAPHDPRQAPQEYVDRYPAEEIKVPENYLDEYPYKDAIGCGPGLRDERLAPFPRTPHAVQVHRQEYYAIITHMDTQIGRMLDALEASPMAENTYVFFTSDHGLAVGRHGLMGKQNMYDHSVRVPFIVMGPDVAPEKTVATPIYFQDVMPTTLELAGVEMPDHVEFQSLMPLICGAAGEPGAADTAAPYPSIYGAYLQLQRMVVHEGFKLILYPEIGKARLYDLDSDPYETNDLADDPAQQARLKQLFARLQQLQQQMNDPLDLTADFPQLSSGQ